MNVKEEEIEKAIIEIKKRYIMKGTNTPITETQSMEMAEEFSLPASDDNKNKIKMLIDTK